MNRLFIVNVLGYVGKTFLRRIIEKRKSCQKRRTTLKKVQSKKAKISTTADEHYGNVEELDNITSIDSKELITEMDKFIE